MAWSGLYYRIQANIPDNIYILPARRELMKSFSLFVQTSSSIRIHESGHLLIRRVRVGVPAPSACLSVGKLSLMAVNCRAYMERGV